MNSVGSAISQLEHDFERAGRLLVPSLTDWMQAGKALSQLATNDALLAMSAGRMGITVITSNAKDFARLSEFRTFQWRVETAKTMSSEKASNRRSRSRRQ
jgi:predicted nucleic acid-binding protein